MENKITTLAGLFEYLAQNPGALDEFKQNPHRFLNQRPDVELSDHDRCILLGESGTTRNYEFRQMDRWPIPSGPDNKMIVINSRRIEGTINLADSLPPDTRFDGIIIDPLDKTNNQLHLFIDCDDSVVYAVTATPGDKLQISTDSNDKVNKVEISSTPVKYWYKDKEGGPGAEISGSINCDTGTFLIRFENVELY
jgi:hypothetical protein